MMFPPLPSCKYQIIYVDPPWDYRGQTQHNGQSTTGGAANHYGTVTLSRLKSLSVPSICSDDCLLFLWATGPHLDQAIDLLRAWGFSWATVGFIWDKQKSNPGYYTMSQCEMCLVGKRGRIPRPRGARNVRQFLSEPRQKHSQKPEEVRRRIGQMFPSQSKIELFARGSVIGWHCWGLEVGLRATI